jgi:hypothetical protein
VIPFGTGIGRVPTINATAPLIAGEVVKLLCCNSFHYVKADSSIDEAVVRAAWSCAQAALMSQHRFSRVSVASTASHVAR